MDLKQASRIYRTYKIRPNDKIETKTFIQVCNTYERYLKEVRNIVSDRDKEIEKLKKENQELKAINKKVEELGWK